MTNSNKKLAVLIDADNAPADIIDRLLEEIAKYGIASVKRIYGDWSHGLSKWKAALLPHAIIPVQQFAYTKGKNATDMALVIDAMDLLYSGNFDGFCLVSSDSDFTRLASRIRESGLEVYGFGEKKTPESFRQACDKFTYIEIFRPEKPQTIKNPQTHRPMPETISGSLDTSKLTQLIKRAVKENADDLGWANLASIGNYISKVSPDFDARLYGFSKLSELIKSLDLFEYRSDNNQLQIRYRKTPNNKTETPDTIVAQEKPTSLVSSSPVANLNTPKKRGRKPKNAAEIVAAPTQTENHTTVSGSPIPPENTPKKRGRKPKNAAEIVAAPTQTENHTTVSGSPIPPENTPKKRGRKPKNAAEIVAAPTQTENHTTVSGSPISPENTPKKRGRKPKNATLETKPTPVFPNETHSLETVKTRQNKIPFAKLIPQIQQVVEQLANKEGWATSNQVAKALDNLWDSRDYGYADNRELIRSIYADWLQIDEQGHIRINKRFISKE